MEKPKELSRYFKTIFLIGFYLLRVENGFAEELTPVITSSIYNEEKGEIVVRWKDIPAVQGKEWNYNIYCYSEPINAQDIYFAQIIKARIPFGEEKFVHRVEKGGEYYYAVVVCDQWGKETRIFTSQNTVGPVRVVDHTPPQAISVRRKGYEGRMVVLEWDCPPIANPEGISHYAVYCSSSAIKKPEPSFLVGKVPLQFEKPKMVYAVETELQGTKIYYYAVTALDGFGNESVISNNVTAGLLPDLAICNKSFITENKDLSISQMYPVKNRKVELVCDIHNYGAVPVQDVEVMVMEIEGNQGKEVAKGTISIPKDSFYPFRFEWVPSKTGVNKIKIEVDPQNKILEDNETNNNLIWEIPVVEKNLYFFWWGDPINLKYANAPAVTAPYNLNEWKRRGGVPLAHSGWGDDLYNRWSSGLQKLGFSGVAVEELGPEEDNPSGLNVARYVERMKKEHPEFFIAVWQCGKPPSHILKKVKEGMIDLVVFEVYLSISPSLKALEDTVEMARKEGIISNTIIALGIGANYGDADREPEKQIEFLEEQIRFIRETAPEMPGVGFFGGEILEGVTEAVDNLCFKYYLSGEDGGRE